MDSKYSDLKSKTFLDFQPSKEALENIFSASGLDDEDLRDYLQEEIDYFLDEVKDDSERRAQTFIEFMDYTDDEKLKAAIKDQFREAYEHCERYANIAVQ
jgi:hypothetical protein